MAEGFRKFVAAFVLLWAFADLSIPGLCQADDNKITPADGLFLISQDKGALPNWSPAEVPSPDQDGSPDECFCCSSSASSVSVFSVHASLHLHCSSVVHVQATPASFSWVPTPTNEFAHEKRRLLPDSVVPQFAPLRC